MKVTFDLTEKDFYERLLTLCGAIMSEEELAELRKISINHDLITIKIEPADEGIERRHSGR